MARERGLVGCVALFESEPMAYARAQVASIGERMDSDWLLALELEALRSTSARSSTGSRWPGGTIGPT
ncbi:MAG: hypothetical protein H7323_03725 [Frankiales bacterium]|nr:hypothetical protein [Frankiales bacterium]